MEKLLSAFRDRYGGTGDVRIFRAPGRVNLIGEHTDYNGGYVFPAAIGYFSTVAVRKTDTGKIRLGAVDIPDSVELDLAHLGDYKNLTWGNYQAGVAWVLQRAGYEIASCDVLYEDTVPFGAGLSSSAAIEVVFALMLATFSNEKKGIDSPVDMVSLLGISLSLQSRQRFSVIQIIAPTVKFFHTSSAFISHPDSYIRRYRGKSRTNAMISAIVQDQCDRPA